MHRIAWHRIASSCGWKDGLVGLWMMYEGSFSLIIAFFFFIFATTCLRFIVVGCIFSFAIRLMIPYRRFHHSLCSPLFSFFDVALDEYLL